jgi:hypothetical protein
MKNILIAAVVILIFVGIVASCSNSSSSKYSGYSDTYKKSASYRDNVGDIANTYGLSDKYVDDVLNRVSGGK